MGKESVITGEDVEKINSSALIQIPSKFIVHEDGIAYIDKSIFEKILYENGYLEKSFKYSPILLGSYDSDRHISLENAKELISSQKNLKISKLSNAVSDSEIRTYEFEGETYLDRLDIGRVYHKEKEKKGMKVSRYFSKEDENPLESIEYQRMNLQIFNAEEELIFDLANSEFPKGYSKNAAKIVAQKYFFKPTNAEWQKKLKEKIGREREYSLKHLVTRVSNFIADEGFKLGYFETEEDKEIFADELKWLQINQRFAFNSPVQFNAGIFNEYGIEGSKGLTYWRNPETEEVSKVKKEYTHPQAHACFIKGPRDDLESILIQFKDEGSIFSLGSGDGQDIGKLRAKGEPLSGGGKSSGPMSFLKNYDYSAGAIKSGGKSRRAARMTTMVYRHADIMEFIRTKVREDYKYKILVENGIEPGMDGEAAETVALQNTNLSVRMDDNFFSALEKGKNIELRYIKSGKVAGTVSADQMLKEISFGSWRIGDPAVQYDSLIQEMHTSKNSGQINSSNPCSEYMFLDDTSCNLNSHNLLAYTDEKGNFDVESFERATWLSAVSADILNGAASYPVKDIAIISPEFRTIGVGYANLGALLMRKGIAYDSDEGRATAGAITSIMTGASYKASSDMAENLGTFKHFEFNREPMIEVMKKHQKNLENKLLKKAPKNMMNKANSLWEQVVKKGSKVGFRNAQTTVLAPTGTISYLMDCDTTGVEPAISLIINKDLAGGGNLTLINKEMKNSLKNLGYKENQIKDIENYVTEKTEENVSRNTIIGAPHMKPKHYEIFSTAFGNAFGQGAIPFEGHIKMLSATQPFISGAISKTNNLPENATVKDIYDGYILGHDLGLKALAVFRNNSKPVSALNFGQNSFNRFKRGEKEDLPFSRNAWETEVKIGGTPIHVMFSEYPNGKPGQIVFLSYKAGSTLGAQLSSNGVITSKALKRGVRLDDLMEGWLGWQSDPQGLVSIDTPDGKSRSHPYIKTAKSPLDFAAKIALIEYLGKTELADSPDEISIENLRGHKNGAFRTYHLENVDNWKLEDVLQSPILGGFEKSDNISNNGNLKMHFENNRGITCVTCGNLMNQTAPNCYECNNCGDKIGGCGI